MRSKVRNARGQVALVRTALLSPSPNDLEQSLPALVEAAQCLASVEHELRARGGEHAELRSELQALQSELRLASQLVEHGAALHQGWAALLGAATAGYMPSGEAAPLTASNAVSVQG